MLQKAGTFCLTLVFVQVGSIVNMVLLSTQRFCTEGGFWPFNGFHVAMRLCATGGFCASWGILFKWGLFPKLVLCPNRILSNRWLLPKQGLLTNMRLAFLRHVLFVYFWCLSRWQVCPAWGFYLIRDFDKYCPFSAYSQHRSSPNTTLFSNFPNPIPTFTWFSNNVFLANLKSFT